MDSEKEKNSWVLDLEAALFDNPDAYSLFKVCKGRTIPDTLRSEVWEACLGISCRGNQMKSVSDIFNLPEQSVLHNDCRKFVAKLGNEEEDKLSVTSDLESILTFYCKSSGLQYESGNGWLDILLPIISLKQDRSKTYNIVEAIMQQYIPRGNAPFHLFRLLLLYHDPKFCSFLDTRRISPEQYCKPWFQSLFASTCSLPVLLCMWDYYLQKADPYFVFFLALVMLLNSREIVLNMKSESNNDIINTLKSLPITLEADDIEDFCSLSQYYSLKTPFSFRKNFLEIVFGKEPSGNIQVSQALCLPISVTELIENSSEAKPDFTEAVRFFLVDCRPAEQYNAGHLPTAFHLDCNLMLQEPAAFVTAVQGLLSAQRQALAANSDAGGEHLCFLGSGRVEEDQYTHMVVASFLQKHTCYVSLLSGGYEAIHSYFIENGEDINLRLQDHNFQKCLMCMRNDFSPDDNDSIKSNSSSTDIFSKISAAMKSKSAEVKGKLFDYIVNPTGSTVERHVKSSDKLRKRYRNMAPVFSIDDDNDGISGDFEDSDKQEFESEEEVCISDWQKNPDVVGGFKCYQINVNGCKYDSHLFVTDSHILVLRDSTHKGFARLVVRRPLYSIVKITSKKNNPEVITFRYGVLDENNWIVQDMDKFLIPNYQKATKLISEQILKYINSKV